MREPGSFPRLGRAPEEGNGHPLQYACIQYTTHPVNFMTEEPGRLQSMGLQRIGHGRATSLSFLSFFLYNNQLHLSSSSGWRVLTSFIISTSRPCRAQCSVGIKEHMREGMQRKKLTLFGKGLSSSYYVPYTCS